MPNSKVRSRTVVPLAVLLAGGLGACSGGDDSSDAASNDGSEVDELLQDGLDAHAEGDLEGARSRYGDVIEIDPESAIAYYNLGLIDQTDGLMDDADWRYRKALEIEPDMASALFNLAIVRTEAGGVDEAIELYQRAVEAKPDMASAHLNLGFLLREEGRSDAADAAWARAFELDPKLAGGADATAGSQSEATPAAETADAAD